MKIVTLQMSLCQSIIDRMYASLKSPTMAVMACKSSCNRADAKLQEIAFIPEEDLSKLRLADKSNCLCQSCSSIVTCYTMLYYFYSDSQLATLPASAAPLLVGRVMGLLAARWIQN